MPRCSTTSGKIGVPDSILQKPGALTPEERAIIQRHPQQGVDILRNIDAYQELIPLILHHHEFYDGRGYPDGTGRRSGAAGGLYPGGGGRL